MTHDEKRQLRMHLAIALAAKEWELSDFKRAAEVVESILAHSAEPEPKLDSESTPLSVE